MKRWMILLAAAAVVLPGCNTASTSAPQILQNAQIAPRAILFLDDPAAHTARLDRFLLSHPRATEMEKIHFLLESVRTSPYHFIRNKSDYNGEDAMRWLRWKMGHRQYASHPILTARDLVERVADRSLKTGEIYQAVLPDGRRVPLQEIMRSELSALDRSLEGLSSAAQHAR